MRYKVGDEAKGRCDTTLEWPRCRPLRASFCRNPRPIASIFRSAAPNDRGRHGPASQLDRHLSSSGPVGSCVGADCEDNDFSCAGARGNDPTVVRATSRNLLSTLMRIYREISLFFVLAILANGAAAQAQSSADVRFNRVTTPGVRRASTSTSSPVRSVSRSAAIAVAGGAPFPKRFTAAVQQPVSSEDPGSKRGDAAIVDMAARICAGCCSAGHH